MNNTENNKDGAFKFVKLKKKLNQLFFYNLIILLRKRLLKGQSEQIVRSAISLALQLCDVFHPNEQIQQIYTLIA